MNWNFSAWAIRNPVPPIVLFVVLCFLGLVSFSKLPVTRFPSVDVPVISVTVTQSGAAPGELESQVTKIIEDAVAGITGVKHILSTLTDGSSVTAIEFRLEINQDRALNDVKDAVARIRSDLPRTIRINRQRLQLETSAVRSDRCRELLAYAIERRYIGNIVHRRPWDLRRRQLPRHCFG